MELLNMPDLKRTTRPAWSPPHGTTQTLEPFARALRAHRALTQPGPSGHLDPLIPEAASPCPRAFLAV